MQSISLLNITNLVINIVILFIAFYTFYCTTYKKKMKIINYIHTINSDGPRSIEIVLTSRSLATLFIQKAEIIFNDNIIIDIYNYITNDSKMLMVSPLGVLTIKKDYREIVPIHQISPEDKLIKNSPKSDIKNKSDYFNGNNYYIYLTFSDGSNRKYKYKESVFAKIEAKIHQKQIKKLERVFLK